ncbi:MBL fold metallo-hydrolase [Acidiferrimicrobium sp. IK]|uniref:MBL fold metallo-hydrolase n=1 Tax=Acidiferrimicrobium sp. IK TaxID=2871700 RepID=UPI0021CB5239|nr:MBL fold metallo-hydrolase [Acidiferrimicrobium sp. IK]MCU4185586.1 MBL fold metallo-hydrolase [Acidiferrimicrobium sp. IK]
MTAAASHDGPLALTVLGCDGSYPGPGGAGSGYLVTCEGVTVWLDAGPGTLSNLQRHVPLEQLDAVVLSHQHPDHWSDLEHFVVACRWFLGRTGVPVYAPPSLRQVAAARINDAASGAEVLDWQATDPADAVTIGPLTFHFSRTDHPVPTHAVRMDAGGRSLGYSADSGPAWAMSSLGPGLDLALCEATFLSDREGTVQHLSARQAGATAREAGAARLVITHIAPGIDRVAAETEAEAAFGGPVEVATIGARYQL